MTGVTILLQVNHRSALYVSARGHNPSTSTSPCCTIRLSPGSQSLYKHITILYLTSLPGVTIPLQVYHHTVYDVSARGSQSLYKYIAILYFTSLPRVTNLLQVHHHIVLYVSVRGRNPSTSTSPYSTISLSPGSQYLYKYITILYFTSLPGVTILLQVHRHTILNVSARVQKPSTSTSPYCTLRLYPGSQSFYNYITILYFVYLPGVTILLQLHHHTVLHVSARGHNPSTSISPCCTWRLCPRWKSLYNYITILHFTIPLCPGPQSFYNYITILSFSSLPGVTIILQVHHHSLPYVSSRGHNPPTGTSPYCTSRLCPGSQSFYKFIITTLYLTSLPAFTNPLQVHHHTVRYVSARGPTHSRSTSPYCTSCLCPGSQFFYTYITILCFTSLAEVTIPLQVHHHTVLYVSAQAHNPSTCSSP